MGQERSLADPGRRTALGWNLAYACVGFRDAQQVTDQVPVVDFGTVPIADIRWCVGAFGSSRDC